MARAGEPGQRRSGDDDGEPSSPCLMGRGGTSSLPPPEQPNVVNHDCRFQSRRRGKGDANGSRERERAYIIIAPPPSDLAQLKKEGKNFPQRPSSFYSIRMIHVGRRKGRKEKRPPRGHLAQEGGGGGGGSSITSFRCFLLSSLHPLSQKRERNRRQEKGSLTRRGSALLERFWGEIFPLM